MNDMVLASAHITNLAGGLRAYRSQQWPGGLMYVRFEDAPQSTIDEFYRSCRKWEEVARVRCRPWGGQEAHLKVTTGGEGCWSTVGLQSNNQMNLGRGCEFEHIILHELGHAFGFMHEHQRSDRDNYLTVDPEVLEAVLPGWGWQVLQTFDYDDATPYDFRSIMHYENWAIHRDWVDGELPALDDPGWRFMFNPKPGAFSGSNWEIGGWGELSSNDARGMAQLYGPPACSAGLGEFDSRQACERNYPGFSCALREVQGLSCFMKEDLPRLSSEFAAQSVPTEMTAGETYQVSVTFKNTGLLQWSDGNQVRLGSLAPIDNSAWGVSRVDIPGGVVIGRNDTATFAFRVVAPTSPGQYTFQWQMLQEGNARFGQSTPSISVQVRYPQDIRGSVDGIQRSQQGKRFLTGWACSTRSAQSVQIEVYVGGGEGVGQRVYTGLASSSSEPVLGSICGTSGIGHRFAVPVGEWVLASAGRPIHVYAVSPLGNGARAPLSGSGVHALPQASLYGRSSSSIPDFTGDRFADFADYGLDVSYFWIHENLRNGAFSGVNWGEAGVQAGSEWEVLAADFTGDGFSDYAERNRNTGDFWVHRNLGNGTFDPGVWSWGRTAPGPAFETLVGDFNGDGRADAIQRHLGSGVLTIYRNEGGGPDAFRSLGESDFTTMTGPEWGVIVADFNGDRVADLAEVARNTGNYWVHLGRSAGGWSVDPGNWSSGSMLGGDTWRSVAGDFDGDGKCDLGDLKLTGELRGTFWVHRNVGGSFAPEVLSSATSYRPSERWKILGE